MKDDSKISLLIEGYPRYGYQTYSQILGPEGNGVCIARLHPEYVAQKYGLERTKRYWLSGQKGEDVISPRSLHNLVKVLRTELRGRVGSVLFLDGLEYLLLYNDMGKTMAALEEIDALLKAAGAEMIIAVDPLTLEQRDAERLWETFPQFTVEELLTKYGATLPQHISAAGLETFGPSIEGQ